MNRLSIVLAIALAAGGLSASAQETRDAQDDSQKEKKICRTYKATGSLTRRTRVCRTEAEWQALNDRSRQGIQDLQGSASGAPACTSTHDMACGTAAGPGGGLPVPTGSGMNS